MSSVSLFIQDPFTYVARVSKNPCFLSADEKTFSCIPYFYLVGVAGPATADVMQKILIHPDVIGSTQQVHWWDKGRHAGRCCVVSLTWADTRVGTV